MEIGNTRPNLFDTSLLAQRRDRADRCGFVGRGDFLHREVSALVSDRLAEMTPSRAPAMSSTGVPAGTEATSPGGHPSAVLVIVCAP